jgi:hypothetical protein
LREVVHTQESLHAEQLLAERELTRQAEENASILLEQRNIAQLMYSNSDTALSVLQEQLKRERSVMEHEIRALREACTGTPTNTRGQLSLMSAEHIGDSQNTLQLLTSAGKTFQEIGESVSSFLHDWESLRMKELQTLSQICEKIESDHRQAQQYHNPRVLQELAENVNILVRTAGDRKGHRYEQNTANYSSHYSLESEETPISSRILSGNGVSPSLQPWTNPAPSSHLSTQSRSDSGNVLASLLLFGSDSNQSGNTL